MTLARFIAKESIVIDGRRLVFERRSKDRTKLIFTDPETLEPVVLDEKKVVEKLFRESETTYRVDMVDDDTPVQVSDYSKEALALKSGSIPAQGARWQTYVNAWKASGLEVRTGPKLKPIRDDVAATLNDSKKPSIPTYERWILRGLNDSAHAFPYFDKRGLATKLDQRVRHLLERETYRLKHCDRPFKTSAIVKYVNGLIEAHFPTLKEIGKSTFYRHVKKLNKYALMMSQRGRVEARKLMPYGSAPMARRILEVVMIDHTPVNIWIRSPCRKYILGKPIITALIDEYSGMVIGFFIGFKEPSAYTVCMAIRHSIMDKLYIQDRYPDIVHVWPALGYFTKLRCDNGAEFHGDSLKASARQVGFAVEWCPKSEPWYKGAIENYFNTIDQEVQHIPGSFESKNSRRTRNGTYKPKDAATFTMEDIVKYVTTFHTDMLNVMPYTEDGRSRLDLWNDSAKDYPPIPPRNMQILEALFARSEEATLTKDGLRVMGLTYSGPNDEFNELYAAGWEGRKLTVKIDDSDISYIWVPHPSKKYIKVFCTTPKKVEGLTYDMWEIIREKVREIAAPRVKAKGKLVNQAQVALIDQIEEAGRKQVMANRKARSFLELGEKRRAANANADAQKLLTPPAPTASAPVPEAANPSPPATRESIPQESDSVKASGDSFSERMRQRRAEREIQKKKDVA